MKQWYALCLAMFLWRLLLFEMGLNYLASFHKPEAYTPSQRDVSYSVRMSEYETQNLARYLNIFFTITIDMYEIQMDSAIWHFQKLQCHRRRQRNVFYYFLLCFNFQYLRKEN